MRSQSLGEISDPDYTGQRYTDIVQVLAFCALREIACEEEEERLHLGIERLQDR